MARKIICSGCGHYRPHYAKRKCKTCYNRVYLQRFRRRFGYRERRKLYDARYHIKRKMRPVIIQHEFKGFIREIRHNY
jgi:hypothetical protein